MRITCLLELAFAAVFVGSAALASPITWTVNVALDDRGTETGFFVIDPYLGPETIVNFNINISAAAPGILSELFDDGARCDREKQLAVSFFRLGGKGRRDMLRNLGYGEKQISQIEQARMLQPEATGKGAVPRRSRSQRTGNPF